MKKATQFFGMMCLVAVLAIGAVSCNKETKTVSSFDITLPTLGGDPFDESKAYIDLTSGAMKWYQGDNVMMYSIDEVYTNSQVQEFVGDATTGVGQAHFTGLPMTVGSEGFFAFYPASKAVPEIMEGNRATFNVGNMQYCGATDLFASTSYAGRIFMDPTGYVGAATCDIIEPYAVFSLKAIFGYLNVRVKDSSNSGKKLTSVTIKDSNMHLTGSMSICIPALKSADLDGMKQLGVNYKANGNADDYWSEMNTTLNEVGYMPNGTGFEVTLDCSEVNGGEGALINKDNKFFFVPLRPGALMDKFYVTLTFSNADDVVVTVPANQKYIMIPGYNTNLNIDLNLANGGI
jgi:hypothetical protein